MNAAGKPQATAVSCDQQGGTSAMNQELRRSPTYDEDFAQWASDQALLLRSGRVSEADLDNIAEELETLGRSEAHALRSHLKQIVCHLLKLVHQPERATRSWTNTIARARQDVAILLDENPSLRSRLEEIFAKASRDGRALAVIETGLPDAAIPQQQAFTMDEVRRFDFLPLRPMVDLGNGQPGSPRALLTALPDEEEN